MYLLIRDDRTREVLGIMHKDEVKKDATRDYGHCPRGECSCLKTDLEKTVRDGVGAFGYYDWVIEEITQSEFETYRDLHGFHVIGGKIPWWKMSLA